MKQVTNDIMIKVSIKKAVGEGKPIETVVEEYGMKTVHKTLIKIIRNETYKSPHYYKCLEVMIKLEPMSREEYPELWI